MSHEISLDRLPSVDEEVARGAVKTTFSGDDQRLGIQLANSAGRVASLRESQWTVQYLSVMV
jgi:hypothetical protein